MQLSGEIDPTLPLLVVAVDEEAEHLRALGLPLLVTGAGKVNAGVAVAVTIGERRPSGVFNLGTAGALTVGLVGTHVVGKVIQHDLDDQSLMALTGRSFSPTLVLGDGLVLATGDVFVSDPVVRDELAKQADLVDMEGYGVAHAAGAFDVPVVLVKHVSDSSDGSSLTTWADTIGECAEILAEWARANVLPHLSQSPRSSAG